MEDGAGTSRDPFRSALLNDIGGLFTRNKTNRNPFRGALLNDIG